MGVKKRQKLKMDNHAIPTEVSVREDDGKSHNDFWNICLLTFLYMLQGVPLGLGAAVPYMLQSDINTASYATQATFSIAIWPFSLKLAWAPLVDAVYSSRIGRRKTWLIPVQCAIGIDLLILASHVDHWFGREPDNPWGPMGVTNPVNIIQLTVAFFGLTMLAATQDIIVDGWALTMLSKRNLGWASTCNTVGQTVGYVVAFILLLSLESPDVANTYLRRIPVEGKGLITFSGFLYFWGVAFLITTAIVAVVKQEAGATLSVPVAYCWNYVRRFFRKCIPIHNQTPRKFCSTSNSVVGNYFGDERLSETTLLESEDDLLESAERSTRIHSANRADMDHHSVSFVSVPQVIEVTENPVIDEAEPELSLIDTYRVMLVALQLKPILQYIGLLFLVKICFAAADSITALKLIELGVSKERMAFLGVLLLPFQAILPLLITRWTNGPSPLSLYSWAMIPRFISSVLTFPLVYYTPHFRQTTPVVYPFKTTAFPSNSTTDATSVYFSWSFYSILLAHTAVHCVLTNMMFVSQMAFNARISDPLVGGTYMTLLNTASNLASTLPSTIMLYLVEPLSKRECNNADPLKAGLSLLKTTNQTVLLEPERIREIGQSWILENATCKPTAGVKACHVAGGECSTIVDGFYLELAFCLLVGLITYPSVIRPLAKRLDSLPPSVFSIRSSNVIKCCRKGRRRQNS
ncbi:Acetyl-coenzyme A transporter 1 [Fasciola hepatica]|uniref:Acetyl-coenzyme A transporter 1 n=1 Tax=Fasciola hepatica TaxID=6192 RepID=A0A4E0RQV1_FASHE|nr:Acetyl-coenzyme A transporter 1 [Fasciola hepatica]